MNQEQHMIVSDEPDEEETNVEGAIVGTATEVTDGISAILSWIIPTPEKIKNDRHGVFMGSAKFIGGLYTCALIALSIVVGVLSKTLGTGRSIDVQITQVNPPPTITKFTDYFTLSFHTVGAGMPPTILLTVAAGVMFVYYGARVWMWPTESGYAVKNCDDGWRWVALAPFNTLIWIIILSFNGQTQLVEYFLIGAVSTLLSTAFYQLDRMALTCCCAKHKSDVSCSKGARDPISDLGTSIVIAVGVLAVGFIIALAYNGRHTPNWIFGLTIAIVIWEVVTSILWCWTIYRASCQKLRFEREWVRYAAFWNVGNFTKFVLMVSMVFGYVVNMTG